MKSLLTIFILLLTVSCSTSNFYNKYPFIYVEFEMPDELPFNEDIPLTYRITNNENVDITLIKGYLAYHIIVSDPNFKPLIPNFLVERIIDYTPITVKKNSQIVIEGYSIPFNEYNFQMNKSYVIQAKYQNYKSYADSINTFIGEIGPYLKKIRFN